MASITGSVAIIVAALGTVLTAQHASTPSNPAPASSGSIYDLPEVKDRTTPYQQQMTPAQRAHADLWGRGFKSDTRLLDRLASIDQHVESFGDPNAPSRDWSSILRDAACKADAVFSATITSADSHPVDNGTFLFTDYGARVTEVFRLGTKTPTVQSGQAVVLTAPGGTMRVEGRVVYARNDRFPPLWPDREYLVLAKHFTTTGAFTVSNREAAYEMGEAAGLSTKKVREALSDLVCK